jgi:L-ascorbate metabolism protein UlaG (beta-lactamase superfamily)
MPVFPRPFVILDTMNKPRRGCLRIFLALLLLLATLVLIALDSTEWLASLGGRVTGARLERARKSPQFERDRFRNTEPRGMSRTSNREMLRRQFFGKEQREPLGPIPIVRRTASDYATPPASGLRATWIGWASVLVEIDGRVVLTDPVWSERCSPSTLVGPKRFHEPPIALAELPHVDFVVISHDHYDHLDMPTVRTLAARGTHFAVPLGIGAHLERWNVPAAQIHELDWNETLPSNGLSLTATPARHYSGRNPRHGNETLWSSWVIAGPRHRVFFSGDSGYSQHFATIGSKYGPFDLTLIKIGASDPTWSEIHMTPEEAIRTHQDVRGRVMLPVHWATFNLAFHPWREPPDRALAAARKAGVTIVIPRPGELVEPDRGLPSQELWW